MAVRLVLNHVIMNFNVEHCLLYVYIYIYIYVCVNMYLVSCAHKHEMEYVNNFSVTLGMQA